MPVKGGEGQDQQAKPDGDEGIDDPSDQALGGDVGVELGLRDRVGDMPAVTRSSPGGYKGRTRAGPGMAPGGDQSAHSQACRPTVGRAAAGRAVFHELVELGLVAGVAQALQEASKFLLFFQAAQRLGLVGVEGALPVAAFIAWPYAAAFA